MKGSKRKPITEITNKDLNKDFQLIKTLFSGKETEENWTERVNSLTRVEEMLNSNNMNDFKETIKEKLNDNIANIMQSIFSMRSTVVFVGFSLISTISVTVGKVLARSTFDIILNNLIDRSKVPSWFTKLTETTIKFLTHTNFHPSVFSLLKKKTVGGSSKHLDLCCIAIKTILLTHGSKESVQIAIEGSLSISSALEYVLKNGLEKGQPGTKSVSREIYAIYKKNWPDKAKMFTDGLNPEMLKRLPNTSTKSSATKHPTLAVSKRISPLPKQRVALQKSTTKTTTTTTLSKEIIPKSNQIVNTPKPIITTTTTSLKEIIPKSNQIVNTPKPIITTTTTSLKKAMPKSKQITNIPKLTRSLSKQPATTLKKVTNTPTSTIVESSPKSNSTKQPPVMLRRSSNSSIISTPATTRSCELKKRSVLANVSTQRNNFEGRLQSSIAANKVLNKLKSSDANTKCLGIQTLIERLKDIPYTSSRKSALPSNVPKKADLLPVLIDLLSCKNLDTKVYEKLTGWDSIADIFVRTLSIRSYCPTLIIADEQRRSQTLDNTQMKIFTSYSQGLKRAKMLLKRNDPLLAHHLLNILKSVMSSEQKVLDASVKHDLQLNASYQPSLELGLLKWMNELIQDYVGLPEDEDKEMLKEGSRWLTESDVTPAEQWFESPMNIQAYTGFVIQQLLETQEEDSKFGILCSMLRSLKMGNERVFEAEMKTLNNVQAEQIKNAIASNSSYSTMDDDSTLSGQVLTQKRKRDSLCLDFSVEAAENDAEEERNRKYLKVEHLTGVNMLGFEVFKFDSFSSSSSEEDPFGFEATKYEVTKNEMIGGEARRSL